MIQTHGSGQAQSDRANDPTPEKDIVELLAAVKAGNQQAYSNVVRHYQNRVFGLAFMIVRDREAAEDISQEAFFRAYTQLHRYDSSKDFYPWLATITVNLSRNWHRDKKPEQPLDQSQYESGSGQVEQLDHSETMIEQESHERLWQQVASLPQSERTAVLLFYRQDLKLEEVAATLGVSGGTIKTLLFRARKKLHGLLAGNTEAGKSTDGE